VGAFWALPSSADVDRIAFTGSRPGGKASAALAGRAKLTLELGGKGQHRPSTTPRSTRLLRIVKRHLR
jgi:hypothetical protein